MLLKGDNGWVEHKENGILYCLDVTCCMFSSGNVTEKARMGQQQCKGETIVDLFTGIGYYTLPLLVHAGMQPPFTVPDQLPLLKFRLKSCVPKVRSLGSVGDFYSNLDIGRPILAPLQVNHAHEVH